jgi:hypothetical protein
MTENKNQKKETNNININTSSYSEEEIHRCASQHICEWIKEREGEKFFFDETYPSYWVRYDGEEVRYDGVITHRFSGRCREYNFESYTGINMIQACMEFFVNESSENKEKWKGR